MEQFSSCYFCGDAVDASLGEYPVVPASVDPEAGERRTIVLCTNCKRKLDPVVEAVVDAVGDDAVTVDRSGSDVRERESRAAADDRDHDDAAEDSASDIGTTLGDDEDLLRPVGDDESEDGDEETGGMEFGRSASGRDEDTGSEGSNADESERSNADESGDSNERGYSSGQRAGGRPTGGSGDDGEADEDDDEDRKRDVTMTRLENTNVMRMMQNREFPVDRSDFVTVASSAYEISPDRCEKVIDLAVKHGLLREEEGQLHAGPEWS